MAQRPSTGATTNAEWTVVLRRRRRNHHHRLPTFPPPPQRLSSSPTAPIPWAPSDPSPPSPSSISALLHKIHSSTLALSSSPFLRRLLSRLPSPLLHLPLPSLRLVVYGVGSLSSSESPRLQLSLALLLHRELRLLSPIELFDPILSEAECSALSDLGCRVLPFDEAGRRRVDGPTLFYMPHCDAALYDNLLGANWTSERLNQMVVLGNSFREYSDYVDLAGMGSSVGRDARYVLMAGKFAEEVRIDGLEEAEDGAMFSAFHSTSWHFFSLDREVEDG